MPGFTEPITLKLEKEQMMQLNDAIEKDKRTRANAVRRGIQLYIDDVLKKEH